VLGRPGHLLSFERNARVQLKGTMFDDDVVRLPQLVDPSLADVTPRSNKIAEHEQFDGHATPTVYRCLAHA